MVPGAGSKGLCHGSDSTRSATSTGTAGQNDLQKWPFPLKKKRDLIKIN